MPLARVKVKLMESVRFARLAADPPSAARAAAALWWVPLKARLLRGAPASLPVRIAPAGAALPFTITDDLDLGTLREVLVLRGLWDAPLPAPPRVVFDVGAHTGAALLLFKSRWPSARVVAFEADPRNAARLARVAAPLDGVTVEPVALGDTCGSVRFYLHPDGLASSTRRVSPAQRAVEVPSLTLAAAMARAGVEEVDLLKFNIEGAELALFADPAPLARVAHLVGEYHEDITGVPLADFTARLAPRFEVSVAPMPSGTPGRYLVRARRRDAGGLSERRAR